MYFIEEKLAQRIEELREYAYRSRIAAERIEVMEDEQGLVNPQVPAEFKNWRTMEIGECWPGRDRYLWLHMRISVPEVWRGKTVVGLFDFGTTGVGNNSGFEAMLYLNGKPYQGVDKNHQEVLLPDSVIGTVCDFVFRLWSGLEGRGKFIMPEHKIKRAELVWLDEAADDLYYTGKAVLETIKLLDENSSLKYELRNLLNDAFLKADWSYPGEEIFYQSVKEAASYLNKKIREIPKDEAVEIDCVGHTHIDVAWLWRLKHTREKISRSFSTVLRLMERYPEYIFLQTQPQLYEYIKQDFPEIYEAIRERIEEGRWEIDGAMWVEADCNLISGESLTRQILLAKRFANEEFGQDMEYLWLPDVFGYSWAMPQVLKKSGIDTFMTTKISWNQYNRMPYDTFWWKGIDGTEVLTHFVTTPDPDQDLGPWYYTYSGHVTPYTTKGSWDNYKQKDINQNLLIAYGYGDGGGGVNREMLEMTKRVEYMPGLPRVKTSTAGSYFRKLQETMKTNPHPVPEWNGELYLELCRGTYTSQACNKKMNRKLEFLYREAEWYQVLAKLYGSTPASDIHDRLTQGWKIVLRNQFHDIIPGSAIHEVYEDSRAEYAQALAIAEETEKESLSAIVEPEEAWFTVANTSNWDRKEIVEFPAECVGIFRDSEGTVLKTQYGREKVYVELENVPSMGMANIHFSKGEAAGTEPSAFYITENQVVTPYYKIQWNEKGQITELKDLVNERQVLAPGERGNVFQVFEDIPLEFDAWNIDIFYQEKHWEVEELQKVEITEAGSLRLVVHMEWKYRKSFISQDMILYADNRRIDFCTEVDFHGTHQLLKVAFPVAVHANYATYDIQYGNMQRPNHWNTEWDMARFEVVGHRFADLSEHNYGVSLLNDCKYGYDVKGNVLRLSLIKTATDPDRTQDQGKHEFTYSLLPHTGDFVEGGTVQEAFALNQPMKTMRGKTALAGRSLLKLSNSTVELDAVKESEDGQYIVVRLHEYAGGSGTVKIIPDFACSSWAIGNLMEEPVENFRPYDKIKVHMKPYEIVTVLISR